VNQEVAYGMLIAYVAHRRLPANSLIMLISRPPNCQYKEEPRPGDLGCAWRPECFGLANFGVWTLMLLLLSTVVEPRAAQVSVVAAPASRVAACDRCATACGRP
jgi:hypothetical protein